MILCIRVAALSASTTNSLLTFTKQAKTASTIDKARRKTRGSMLNMMAKK